MASHSAATAAAGAASTPRTKWSSNLPLVFSKGQPRSLESLNLRELQRFLSFVLFCERGIDGSHRGSSENEINSAKEFWPDSCPEWWPKDVTFVKDELLKTKGKKGYWSSCVRKVLRSCYAHHNTIYLLEFSGKLFNTCSANTCAFIDNGDGTKTLKNVKSGKLLVTFRAENQVYDEDQEEDPLLPLVPSPTTSGSRSPLQRRASTGRPAKSVSINSPLKLGPTSSSIQNGSDPVLPSCPDVYLCDTCDKDFDSFKALLTHESICRHSESVTTEHVNKASFLSYFHLSDGISTSKGSRGWRGGAWRSDRGSSEGLSQASISMKRPKAGSYSKLLTIDLSSPLGTYILRNKKANAEVIIDMAKLCEKVRREARNCLRVNDFPVTCLKRHRRNNIHIHQYCFSPYQRWKKRIALATGLNPVSLRLYQECSKKVCHVRMRRWEDVMKARRRRAERKRLLLQEQEQEGAATKLNPPAQQMSGESATEAGKPVLKRGRPPIKKPPLVQNTKKAKQAEQLCDKGKYEKVETGCAY